MRVVALAFLLLLGTASAQIDGEDPRGDFVLMGPSGPVAPPAGTFAEHDLVGLNVTAEGTLVTFRLMVAELKGGDIPVAETANTRISFLAGAMPCHVTVFVATTSTDPAATDATGTCESYSAQNGDPYTFEVGEERDEATHTILASFDAAEVLAFLGPSFNLTQVHAWTVTVQDVVVGIPEGVLGRTPVPRFEDLLPDDSYLPGSVLVGRAADANASTPPPSEAGEGPGTAPGTPPREPQEGQSGSGSAGQEPSEGPAEAEEAPGPALGLALAALAIVARHRRLG